MSTVGNGGIRSRTERLVAQSTGASVFAKLWTRLFHHGVRLRLLVTLSVAILLCVILRGWNPPFAYRLGYVPDEMIVSRTAFKAADPERTAQLRDDARAHVRPIYQNDPSPMTLLESECFDQLLAIRKATSVEEIPAEIVRAFLPIPTLTPIRASETTSPDTPSGETSGTDRTNGTSGIAIANRLVETERSREAEHPRETSGFVVATPGASETSSGITIGPTTPISPGPPGTSIPTAPITMGSVPSTSMATSSSTSPYAVPADYSQDLLHYPQTVSPSLRLERLRQALLRDVDLTNTRQNIRDALRPIRSHGLLRDSIRISSAQIDGVAEISVCSTDDPAVLTTVRSDDVRLGDGKSLQNSFAARLSVEVAEPLSAWWYRRLSNRFSTLTLDEQRTLEAREAAAAQVPEVINTWLPGEILVESGRPLNRYDRSVLREEYEVFMSRRPVEQRWMRASAMSIVIFVLLGGLGCYLYRSEPRVLRDWKHFGTMAILILVAAFLMQRFSGDLFRAEVAPLLIVAQIMAVAYRRETAMLVSLLLVTVVTMGIGHTILGAIVFLGIAATMVHPLATIRSRRQLIHIGLGGAVVALLLSILTGLVENQPLGGSLIALAIWTAIVTFLSCLAITGLLPYIERWFGVLTDISLMELGDVTQPLIQELIRRAGSTYNHSIAVGSIGEAAANAIGARGLLVRIGAYYHDIGKLLKPDYFTENQNAGENRHDSLNPAMSARVIMAHVKEGEEIAERFHLPPQIIDLIVQHHGTSRIEYFYRKAIRQVQEQHQAEQEKLREQEKVRADGAEHGPDGWSSEKNEPKSENDPKSEKREERTVERRIPADVVMPDAAMMIDPGMGRLSNPGILLPPNSGESAKSPAKNATPVEYDIREHLDETITDESLYRYPGPKPQTKEAVVLMLADCAESACRSLREPGPTAIEEMVRNIASQRLQDGQYDESGLTLQELHRIEEEMIRALISHYHARIRYPGQKN